MGQNTIDLHIHSCKSDGEHTPIEILKIAQEKHLQYISITDHSNCLAYQELAKEQISNYYTGNLICGCELATYFENVSIEILGYGVSPDIINKWHAKEFCQEKIEQRDRILYQEAVEKIRQAKLELPKELQLPDKLPYDGYFKKILYEAMLPYLKNQAFFKQERIDSYEQFQRKGLNKKESPIHISEQQMLPKTEEIVELIHQAGGLAFLAHIYKYEIQEIEKFLDIITQKVPLDGIETYYSTFTNSQIQILEQYTQRNHLYVSGGSDYHGKAKPGIQMGTGKGNLKVKEEKIQEWIKQVRRYKNDKTK